MDKRRVLTYLAVMLAVWVGLVAGTSFVSKLLLDPNDVKRFVERGETVWLTVLSKDEQDVDLFGIPKSNTITYSYEVAGVTFTGKGHAGEGTPHYEQIAVGDRIHGTYDPRSPQDSIPGNGRDDLQSTEQWVPTLMVTIPIFPMITIGSILFAIMVMRKKE